MRRASRKRSFAILGPSTATPVYKVMASGTEISRTLVVVGLFPHPLAMNLLVAVRQHYPMVVIWRKAAETVRRVICQSAPILDLAIDNQF
jgi:hypothetical protein